MQFCPTCQTEYPDGVALCARDGSPLAAVGGQAATMPSVGLAAPASSFSPPVQAVAAGAAGAVPLAEPDANAIFDSLVGATLAGRYLIIRRIGEGGMGAVYEAKHTIIGKRVAVKVLLEKFLTKSDFVARLLQEARLASAIGHEHIVDVTDFGTTDDGRAFVAMEFLDGESLAQLVMREAPLPVERSLRIARQVASALGAAHAKGIVHRDVKPENVYLIRRGDTDFVKVVDFGISKAVKQGQGDDVPDYHLTHTGLLLGTPLYMSPEQARGDEDLDHRVDVWAMGVMLYECLTGEVPFRANNYLGIISQVLTHTAVPPSKLRPELGIPEAVEAVVMRAMEKDRGRRYALMSDVEQDLERLLAGDQNVGATVRASVATAPPPRGPARGRLWVWSAAVAALVGGVAMVLARPDVATETRGASSSPAAAGRGAAVTRPPGRTGVESGSTPESTPPPAPADGADPAMVAGGALIGQPEAVVPSRRPGHPGRRSSASRGRSTSANTRPSGNAELSPGTAGPATRKGGAKSEDPVIRGVLPSRSGEGYPDN